MKKAVQRQMEKIMDETEGQYADVIVQFRSDRDRSLMKLLEIAVDTERNRQMMVDPSVILPPESSAFEGTQSARRKLRVNDASLVANVALMADSLAPLISSPAISMAADFLSSAIVQKAVGDMKSRLKGKADTAEPLHLENIGGARVMIGRGTLPKVIKEQGEKIEGVYENTHIRPPKVTEAASAAVAGPYQGTTWGLEHAKALSAWSAFETRGKNPQGMPVRVAVLDTGVDPSHPDIAGKLVDFADFGASGNIVQRGVAQARDSGRHGTHVCGTIVGGNASGSWIGMAPEAELICGLVLNGAAGGTLAQVIAGIDWAVKTDAQIVNLSLGGLTFDSTVGTPYQRAIVDALVRGVLVVAAIGNDGHQTTGAPGNDYFSLAVGAHDVKGRSAGFSGGRTHILNQSSYINSAHLPLVYTKPDLSAPGVGVKSSVPGGKWESLNGTSMATPHVSGAAALLFAATDLAQRPRQQRAFLARDLLLGGVTDVGEAGQDQRYGYGTINVLRSIDEAHRRGY